MAVRLLLPLVAMLALGAVPGNASTPQPGAAAESRSAAQSHVFLIVLENREAEEVIGNPQAPYLNRLAHRGVLATRYHGITHPSLPNYLALLGGSTFGIAENCLDCLVHGDSLAGQLSRAGISWRAYMGGMPSACYRGDGAGAYAKRHNPFMYFPAIASRAARCARVVPERRLGADLRRHRLPAFGWLTPDLCADAHDCGIEEADRHLSRLAPRIVRQLGPRGLLIVTFDEGTTDAGCCGGAAGGRVATILVGPRLRRGARIRRPADHYSLLAALEDRFGLPRLRHARGLRPLF